MRRKVCGRSYGGGNVERWAHDGNVQIAPHHQTKCNAADGDGLAQTREQII